MRVVIYITGLYFLLLKGYDVVYASSCQHRISYAVSLTNEKQEQVTGDNTDQQYPAFSRIPATNEKEPLISEELEDEDNNDFARKYKLLARRPAASADAYHLSNLYNSQTSRSHYFGQLSAKYITLSVLRI